MDKCLIWDSFTGEPWNDSELHKYDDLCGERDGPGYPGRQEQPPIQPGLCIGPCHEGVKALPALQHAG